MRTENQVKLSMMVSSIYRSVQTVKVLQALYGESIPLWEELIDMNTKNHLVRGIRLSSTKSDAIRTYVAKLVKLYMTVHGETESAWTIDSMASENAMNVATINKLTSELIDTNEVMFSLVASRLMGYDSALIKAALATDKENYAVELTNYLVGRHNLNTVEGGEVTVGSEVYPGLVYLLKNTDINNEWYLTNIRKVIDTELYDNVSINALDEIFSIY